MVDSIGLSPELNNQDPLRASVLSLDPEAIVRALRWLRGQSPYPYPISIHLYLTLRCTARCLHCKQWTWPEHSEFSLQQLEQLFSTFEKWSVRTVTFGGGNPLLYSHIGTALRMARAKSLHIGIISEGVDMTDQLADDIRTQARWIRFSLDGPCPEVHDVIRNAPGLFDRVVENIACLKAHPSALRIGLNCVVQKRNINALQEMIDLAVRLKVDSLLFKVPHGDDPGGHFLPSEAEWGRFVTWVNEKASQAEIRVPTNLKELSNLLGTMFGHADVERGRPIRSFYINSRIKCYVPLLFLVCDSNGNMFPCDYTYEDTCPWAGRYGEIRRQFCLGNVLQNSQAVLDTLAVLLRDHIHGLPASGYDECGNCTRFCQLNTALTQLDRDLQSEDLTEQRVRDYFDLVSVVRSQTPFL